MAAWTQTARVKQLAVRMNHWDVTLCERGNRWLDKVPVHRFFGLVSRLGDGVLWYSLMVLLPLLGGIQGLIASILMATSALLGVTIYRRIKLHLRRPRPFALHPHIRAGARILDEYSFPSGHTLHAVAFMILLGSVFPWMLVFLAPFAVLTGLARVVLGLHYPSDVAAGAVLGALIGSLTLALAVFLL